MATKTSRPKAVAFDVIGTLFPLEPLRPRIMALGLPAAALEGWFATGLRDAFALAITDEFTPFAKVLEAALDTTLAEQRLSPIPTLRTSVIDGLEELRPREGAAEALALLAEANVPALALTNGARASTLKLIEHAGFRAPIAHVVSVDEVKRSKPRAEVYRQAATVASVEPGALALIAAHPWDIQGAHAAGLTTAYLDADRPFSPVMHDPDVQGSSLAECVARLLALPAA